jgi:hypothetical protein
MNAIRLHVSAEEDGELRLRGLPLRKGDLAEVIVLTDLRHDQAGGEAVLAILRHDPAWAWLWDLSEDLYGEGDVRPSDR